MGIGSSFIIPSPDWRRRLIARQHLTDSAAKTWSLSARVGFISKEVLKKGSDSDKVQLYTLEAARLFSEIFDKHYQRCGYSTMRDISSHFQTPEVPPRVLSNLVTYGQCDYDNRQTQLLMCKAIGILSICEQNRKQASRFGFISYLIKVVSGYKKDTQVVGNAL